MKEKESWLLVVGSIPGYISQSIKSKDTSQVQSFPKQERLLQMTMPQRYGYRFVTVDQGGKGKDYREVIATVHGRGGALSRSSRWEPKAYLPKSVPVKQDSKVKSKIRLMSSDFSLNSRTRSAR